MKKLYEVGVKECSNCEYYLKCTECALPHQCQDMKAEIERLKVELNYTMAVNKPNDAKRVAVSNVTRFEIRAEAIKKYIEKLKSKAYLSDGVTGFRNMVVDVSDIDKTYEEMMGEG